MAAPYKNFIPEYWSSKLTKNYDNEGTMSKCVNTDWERDVKSSGDTVNIQTFGNVTTQTYSGSIPNYERPQEDTQQLVMDQKQFFALGFPDIDKVQANIKLVNGYTNRAKISVDLAKDTFLLAKHADVPAANTLGTTGSPIALTKDNIYGYIKSLAKILKNNNAFKSRDGKPPWVVINPDIEDLLTSSPEFIAVNNPSIAQKTIIEGSIGKVSGLEVLTCTNLVAVSSKYYIMAGINDAITFASQIEEIESLRSQTAFEDLVRGLYVYGAKTVVPTALAKIIATIA